MFPEGLIMAITVEAVYENGVLKPTQPLPVLPEGARLWLTLHVEAEENCVQRSYGLLGWTGDSETVRRVALDPEFDILESP
jgi:predicted DNA-binding antitoxin AbrB/MazE fold protein